MESRGDRVWQSSRVARNFLKGIRGGIPFAREQMELLHWIVRTSGVKVKSVLDLGCGNGILGAGVLELYPDAQATLVDFSPPMLEAARRALSRHASRVRFVEADFGSVRWSGGLGSFDLIVSGFAIHHQPDRRKQAVYREIFRMLRPGGLFLNLEHVASATPGVERLSDELFIDALHAFHRNRKRAEVSRDFKRRPDKAANILAPVETQCRWLREIGYRDVDCFFKSFELALFGGWKSKSRGRSRRGGRPSPKPS